MTIPRAEHPKPQCIREDWINLNGTWTYTFDLKTNTVAYEAVAFGSAPLTSGVMSIQQFLDFHNFLSLRDAWVTKAQSKGGAGMQRDGADGFIPDIVVPVELPSIVQTIFGAGEPRLNISGQQRISFEGCSLLNH